MDPRRRVLTAGMEGSSRLDNDQITNELEAEIEAVSEPGATRRNSQLLLLSAWIGLFVAVFAIYGQLADAAFIEFDDNLYVYQNGYVRAGLTAGSIRWALTAKVAGNWMPLTLLSHMLDVQLFGMNSGMHHMMNAWIHFLASGLLLLCIHKASGSLSMALFTAFAFAVHPLHVGSVAWIAERKDVLSAFFWFLALLAYLHYRERPSWTRYLAVLAAFGAGLMAKPMLVTFPFTLLLLDIWPLRRSDWRRALVEKVPLLVLCIGESMITMAVQSEAGAMWTLPFDKLAANALLSLGIYLSQMVWPAQLSLLYPFPGVIPLKSVLGSAAVLVAVSAIAVWSWRSRPYLATGWFWFLGTLVPVIGLIQVGAHGHADRYMYIPMVGLCLLLSGAGAEAAGKWPRLKLLPAAIAVLFCVGWTAASWREASYWHDSETIFRRALEVTENNWVMENNLGHYLMAQKGDYAEALVHLRASQWIKPDYGDSKYNLATCLMVSGRCAEAIPGFLELLQTNPNFAEANNNVGYCLAAQGEYGRAIPYLEAAVKAKPELTEAAQRLAAARAATR